MSHDSPTRHQRTFHTYMAENWLIVAGLAFAVVVLVVLGLVLANKIRTRPVEVPNVVGMTAAQAHSTLEQGGLSLGEQSKSATEDTAPGLIVGQDPDVGEQTRNGSSIDVIVAVSPKPISMPDVRGKTTAEAKKILSDALLVPVDFDVYGTGKPKGQVADQIPKWGRTIDTGSQVVVLISASSSAGGVAIPDVTGRDYVTATNEIQASGLDVSYFYDNVTPAPQGQVITQYPRAGARVEEGTIVELTVSAFPTAAVE